MPLIETKGAASAQGFGLTLGGAQPVYIEDVFSTYLYTGNGSTQTITNGIDLSGKGGLVWFKYRAGPNGPANHQLYDTARGVQKKLATNTTAAQATEVTGLTAFNANGFSFGSDGNINASSSDTYASWTFRKQPKFFDVVTYTGTGSQQSINHALGSVPGCIIVKRTDTTSSYWGVYHRSLTDGYALGLNTTDAQFNAPSYFVNSASQTATQFTVGTSANVNASGGTYVAYLFAHNAGGFGLSGTDNVISCGSFTTDGSGGASVNLGWEPQWLFLKAASTSGYDSVLVDNMRGFPASGDARSLRPESSASEGIRFVYANATGFSSPNNLGPSITWVYIAIRRGPMKVPTSGTSVFGIDTFTGTNSMTTRTGYAFSPDMTISRDVGSASVSNNFVLDRLRGWAGASQATINTNSTSAEVSSSGRPDGTVVSKGIQLYGNSGGNNWFVYFARAPGFFDEVCYTGTGVARTVNHNLGVAPELMFICRRSGGVGFMVYSANYGTSGYSILNSTEPFSTTYWGSASIIWNNTAPTSSVFSLGTSGTVNFSADTFVAYLFATCPGVSKVGGYTGTGALQTINCGFTGGARFVLIKRTDSTGDWYVYDSARGISSGNDPYLFLNSTAAEVTGTNYVDTTSVGFQVTAAAPAGLNANGGTYIFLAIA